jgi:hypothetical protein
MFGYGCGGAAVALFVKEFYVAQRPQIPDITVSLVQYITISAGAIACGGFFAMAEAAGTGFACLNIGLTWPLIFYRAVRGTKDPVAPKNETR